MKIRKIIKQPEGRRLEFKEQRDMMEFTVLTAGNIQLMLFVK